MEHTLEVPKPIQDLAPRQEYLHRLAERQQEILRHGRLHQLLANARMAVFLAGCVVAWFVFVTSQITAGWLLLPAAFFLVLVIRHDLARQAMHRAQRAATFYERGLARLEDRWAGMGQATTRFLDPPQAGHPYALDLDLFGKGSLFELLCTARTRSGEDTLASWLLTPAAPGAVHARQSAVAELRNRLDWREMLALLGADVPEGIDLDGLMGWGAAPPVHFPRWVTAGAFVLPVLALLALVAWIAFDIGPTPLLLILMAEIALTLQVRPQTKRILVPVERRAHDLALFSGLLHALEIEWFQAESLRRLQAKLYESWSAERGAWSDFDRLTPHAPRPTRSFEIPPSRRIAQLQRLIDWLNAWRNQLFAPIAFVLLWHLRFALRIEAWRRLAGPAIARWLAIVGELEALAALAAYSYENPSDPFPEIRASDEGQISGGPSLTTHLSPLHLSPVFEGVGLGHPLLPRALCVSNDVRLTGERRLLMVSGSNMSGKSTLLRTVGINTVLALAGAPVRAQKLRLSPLTIGATLRVQDSLQEGRSRFYAEILRIRQLVELAQGKPQLLFLLDELLQGTNSHDRRLGAEKVIKGLLDHGAIGLVTTHDLALTQIVDRLGPRAANVHFQDHFENGAMTFDYRMRPGVVEHSNALALMRAVGIEV